MTEFFPRLDFPRSLRPGRFGERTILMQAAQYDAPDVARGAVRRLKLNLHRLKREGRRRAQPVSPTFF
jgi:hypothetical protein